jgi:hypothetical protein
MKLLCKFPTRSRPERFLETLRGWVEAATNPQDITWLISYDRDDATMTPAIIERAHALTPNLISVVGESANKIHAINRDINEVKQPWDIIIVLSDDFFVRRHGWDEVVRHDMRLHFPDTDGSLWYFDGAQKDINTLPCLGRAYYNRFNYIYHNSYGSFFCDNEQSDVGKSLNKLLFIQNCIASHEHPCWLGGVPRDALYDRNNRSWIPDKANYERRKAAGFPA